MLRARIGGLPRRASSRVEGEGAAEVLGVPDLNDRRVRFLDENVARDPLVFRHRDQVVRPRRVDDSPACPRARHASARHLDRGSGVVRDGDITAREGAEEDALADIRVADQKEGRRPGRRAVRRRPRCDYARVRDLLLPFSAIALGRAARHSLQVPKSS